MDDRASRSASFNAPRCRDATASSSAARAAAFISVCAVGFALRGAPVAVRCAEAGRQSSAQKAVIKSKRREGCARKAEGQKVECWKTEGRKPQANERRRRTQFSSAASSAARAILALKSVI